MIILTILAALLLPLQEKVPAMEELLETLSDGDLDQREDAEDQILEHWQTWKESDLAALQKAGGSSNPGLANTAKKLLLRIETKKKLGPDILKVFPQLDAQVSAGTQKAFTKVLMLSVEAFQNMKIKSDALQKLAQVAADQNWDLDVNSVMQEIRTKRLRALHPLLVHWMNGKDLQQAHSATLMVGTLGLAEHRKKLAALLEKPGSAIRMYAIRSLAILDAQEYTEDIAKHLKATDDRERSMAIQALGSFDSQKHLKEILELFTANQIPPRHLRESFHNLKLFNFQKHRPELQIHLNSKWWFVRMDALRFLSEAGTRDDFEKMLPLLKDSSADVRMAAILACTNLTNRPLTEAQLDQVREAIKPFSSSEQSHYRARAGLARLRLGDLSKEEQFKLLQEYNADFFQYNPQQDLFEALLYLHEKESFDLYQKPLEIAAPISTPEELKKHFQKIGLDVKLSDLLYYQGYTAAGRTLSVRRLLFRHHLSFFGGRDCAFTVEKNKFDFLPVNLALEYWRERLRPAAEKKKEK